LHANLAAVSLPGGTSDPGLSGITSRGIVPIISLQSDLSIFDSGSRFYNPAATTLGGILILIWAIAILRKPFSRQGALLSLASASVLTLLPIYHRTYDAKLLLLTVPACALLWIARDPKRWTALVLTAAGIFFTSDIPIALSLKLAEPLPNNPPALPGKLLELALLRPAPAFLLALGCFYLWTYLQYPSRRAILPHQDETSTSPAMSGAT